MLSALNQSLTAGEVFRRYRDAKRRLLIIEYDGALLPYDLNPEMTMPGSGIKNSLDDLCSDPRNVVILLSGRDMQHLDKFWASSQLILVAENGAYYRVPTGTWQSLFRADNYWIDRIANALCSLSLQYEGSFVERKNHSVVWHHRAMKEPLADAEIRRIVAAVNALNHHGQFMVRHNEFALELSTAGIDAGSFIARWIGGQFFDYTLALGTSRIEQTVFELFSKEACTVRVGAMTSSKANFHLFSQQDVVPFLEQLRSFGPQPKLKSRLPAT